MKQIFLLAVDAACDDEIIDIDEPFRAFDTYEKAKIEFDKIVKRGMELAEKHGWLIKENEAFVESFNAWEDGSWPFNHLFTFIERLDIE